MPRHDLLENPLTPRLHNIPMTRNDSLKIPLVNLRHTPPKALAILRTNPVPNQPLLPLTIRICHRAKELGEDPTRRRLPRPTKLLCGRIIEQQIRLYERLGRLMVEHNLLVLMRMYELVVELGVELGIYGGERFVFGEDVGEGDGFVILRFALFGEAFGAEDFGVGIGLVPGAEKDVVLVYC